MCIRDRFKSTIDNEVKCRKDSENRALRTLDEKYLLLKQDQTKEAQQRTQEVEYLREQLDLKLPKLADQVRMENSEREETDNNILKRFLEECNDLNTEQKGERKAREENEQAIFDMLIPVISFTIKNLDAKIILKYYYYYYFI